MKIENFDFMAVDFESILNDFQTGLRPQFENGCLTLVTRDGKKVTNLIAGFLSNVVKITSLIGAISYQMLDFRC